ncbi:MAG: class I SAM-dependent methyltransferase [Cyanobacteriota bacterium]
MDKIEKQIQHFENISEEYFKARSGTNCLKIKSLIWEYFFKDKQYLKKSNLTVLEPMCGFAEGKNIIEKSLNVEIKYTGFDYSDSMIGFVKDNSPDIDVYKMDITKFSSDKTYDIIILIGALHHVPDYTFQSIELLSESLNKGGYFINFEPTNNNYLFKIIREQIYKYNHIFDNETERAFELNELNDIFLSNNYKLIDQIYPGLLSYVLYYNPDAFPFLNIGNDSLVSLIFNIEKILFRSIIGKTFSFITISLWQKE